MEKKQETMPRDAESDGNVFTGICTVGALAPNLDKVLDVNDIAMVIVIDKKKRKHLRISHPTITLDQLDNEWGMDRSGCFWKITCKEGNGDPKHKVKEYLFVLPYCTLDHQPSDAGPC